MSAAWDLQKAVLDNLGGISAPVFDSVPDNQKAPYVVIGDDTSLPFNTAGGTGFESTLTIHSWSTYRGRKEIKNLMGEVFDSLDRADLTVSGYTVLGVDSEFDQTFLDSDGVTRHGVQRFRVLMSKQ